MEKNELITQTKLAFDFIQKLYFEVSYLIKEIEGLLAEEEEKFIIGRTSGYAIVTRSSNALDSFSINYWMYKKLAVCFIPTAVTKTIKGQTVTPIDDKLKVLYIRIVLDDKNLSQPTIYYGVLKNFSKKGKAYPEKFELLMAAIEYSENKIFTGGDTIHYEDAYVEFSGKLDHVHLYDINNGEEVAKKFVVPALRLFRES